jgi:hypothetical protein
MQEVWDTALASAAKPDELEIVFYIDQAVSEKAIQELSRIDDHESLEKLEEMKSDQVKAVFGPRRMYIGRLWNAAYKESSGEIVMLCADDLRFRTSGWDDAVREAILVYKDRINLVWADDKICGSTLPTHPFVHRNWVESVGHFACPFLLSARIDHYLLCLARRVRRSTYLKDVVIEHMHHTKLHVPQDLAHAQRFRYNSLNRWIYSDLRDEFSKDAKKLTTFIENFNVE